MWRFNLVYQSLTLTRLVLSLILLPGASLFVEPTNAWPHTPYPLATLQQEDGWSAIKTDEGILFVWNQPGLSFSILIKGKEVKPLNDPEHIYFSVDGRILQIQLAGIINFARDAKEKKLDDKAILAAHRDWEAKYVEGLIHSKLTVRTFNTKLSNGGDAMMWQFDMPKEMNAEAQKELYLTLVAKDYVLLLNSEATAAFPDADGRKFLLDTIATLKISSTPIDVKKLSESIRAGNKP
jgi:hypothetical protein